MEDLLVVNTDGQIPSEFDLNLKTLFDCTQPRPPESWTPNVLDTTQDIPNACPQVHVCAWI